MQEATAHICSSNSLQLTQRVTRRMHHLEGKRALWLNGKEEAYIHTKILFKKWKSSSYNANGVKLIFLLYLTCQSGSRIKGNLKSK